MVVGSEKMAVFDDTAEHKLVLYPHKVEWKNRIPTAIKADAEAVALDDREPLRAECQHFLLCGNENSPGQQWGSCAPSRLAKIGGPPARSSQRRSRS